MNLFTPVLAAQLLNAYYSALLLHQLQGTNKGEQTRSVVMNEIVDDWKKFIKLAGDNPDLLPNVGISDELLGNWAAKAFGQWHQE